jgi:hypothetical protein
MNTAIKPITFLVMSPPVSIKFLSKKSCHTNRTYNGLKGYKKKEETHLGVSSFAENQ